MPSETTEPRLSERFDRALAFTSRLHRRQIRKGTSVPYVSHLLAVAGLALEHGADEDTAIAALLHDAVEDQGGAETLERIREGFGVRVARIVAECSDTDRTPKPPWRERKEVYLAHLAVERDPDVLLVSASDKLHNARTILVDARALGDDTFERFAGGKGGVLWYYATFVQTLRDNAAAGSLGQLVDELERVVGELLAVTGGGG